MSLHVLWLLAALSVAACNTPWAGNPARTKDIGVGIAAPPASAPAPDRVTFDCDGGTSLTALFDDETGKVTITPAAGADIVLPVEVTGAGYAYANGKYQLRGMGEDAIWTETGKAALTCKARPVR